jgi:hypothetical protein
MKNDWEKKEKTCSAHLSSKIFANSARVWTRSTSLSSFQRSNWSPTYILHLFHLEDTSHFYSSFSLNPSKSAFLPKNHMLFIVSKQCACSRRVHIEAIWIDLNIVIQVNNSDNDSFGSFLSKNRIFCSITRC